MQLQHVFFLVSVTHGTEEELHFSVWYSAYIMHYFVCETAKVAQSSDQWCFGSFTEVRWIVVLPNQGKSTFQSSGCHKQQ